jgi:hypothetical protein
VLAGGALGEIAEVDPLNPPLDTDRRPDRFHVVSS